MSFTQELDVVPPSFTSATHSCSNIVSLPLELWLEVFSFACYVPGILDIANPRAIEAYSSDSNGIVLDNLISVAMKTKRAIGSVCRSWWWCIQPFMFEHIRIKSGAHALVVARRLEEVNERGTESCHPGRWVKRVEIHSSDQYWDEERSDAMVRILDNAPNVSVFSDLFCCSPSSILDHEPLLRKLAERCAHGSLRRLEWYSGSPSSLNRLLHNMEALEVLLIGRGFISSDFDSQINLPHLTTIVAGEYANSCRFQDVQCPSLKSLVVHRSVMPHSKFDIRSHFEIDGKVEHMRLNFEDWRTNYVPLENFNALTSLSFDFGRRFTASNIKELTHQLIERLEFANFAPHERYSRATWNCLREFMFGLLDKRALPSLSSIGFLVPERFLSHGQSLGSCRDLDEFWEPWMKACKSRNIQVDMSLGIEAQVGGIWRTFDIDHVLRS
ncbi:hypothetical protein SCHPADRAFT_993501 [Schizopora paradoxa]|uniref:F-box domain-containing protein n=1 Tax=Schizopora paradoxa TaxID=27342 RepID=A0A0H2SNH9_9AGAM|nr:hypothetical protein SCHPADRAFT_993501 [Schizopora paradoxa]